MDFVRKHTREVVVSLLILSNVFVWLAVYQRQDSKLLSVYFLDVGQGDAILIDSPSHGRVLVDGGKNRQVLAEIDKVLLFGERKIDVVLGTHPDADHIGGLPEVISRYDVGLYIWPGLMTDKVLDNELWERLEAKEIPYLRAERGMTLNFGDGAKLVILFPNQDVSKWDENDASIVAKLIYGEHSFLLTGDSPTRVENILLNIDSSILDADVLKAGHHGSRTSTSKNFLEAVTPEHAIISAGLDNSYGHPHQEVLNNLAAIGAAILNTASSGTIKFQTNGKILELK